MNPESFHEAGKNINEANKEILKAIDDRLQEKREAGDPNIAAWDQKLKGIEERMAAGDDIPSDEWTNLLVDIIDERGKAQKEIKESN